VWRPNKEKGSRKTAAKKTGEVVKGNTTCDTSSSTVQHKHKITTNQRKKGFHSPARSEQNKKKYTYISDNCTEVREREQFEEGKVPGLPTNG